MHTPIALRAIEWPLTFFKLLFLKDYLYISVSIISRVSIG